MDKPNNIIKSNYDEFHIILGNLVELNKLDQFDIVKTIDYNMIAIASKEHYLSHVDDIKGVDLASEEIVIFSKEYSMFYHEEIIKNFEQDGFKPNIVHIADSFSELILMIFLNKGISVIPKESLSKSNLDNISLINIKNTNHRYVFSSAINKKYANSGINDFVYELINKFYEYHINHTTIN